MPETNNLNTALGEMFTMTVVTNEVFTIAVGTKSSSMFAGGGEIGPQGPQGIQGETGPTGLTGDSAYEVALTAGFVGTEAAWLASLVGAQGPQGIQGEQGIQGIQGLTGATGADSVVPGPQGEQGIQGIQGIQGETGPAGADGLDGTSFTVNVVDLLANQNLYDAELEGFAMLASDTGDLYLRETATPGVWSAPTPFRGPTGLTGDQGIQGPAGADGADGADSTVPGPAGADGDSAYDIAVAAGYADTEANWLLSLVGADGAQGIQGIQGVPGDTGPAGTDGVDGVDGAGVVIGGTAGQLLSKIDATDYNTAWVDPPSISLGTAIAANTTLTDADFAGYVFYDVNAVATITVPPSLTGTEPVTFQQTGAGTVTFAPGAGVTIQSLNSLLSIAGQFGSATLVPKGGDVYGLIGALA